MLALIAR